MRKIEVLANIQKKTYVTKGNELGPEEEEKGGELTVYTGGCESGSQHPCQ